LRVYQEEARRHQQFIELVSRARQQLELLYLDPAVECQPDSAKRAHKQQILAQLRQDYAELKKTWNGPPDFDAWFQGDINNARLNTIDTYYQLVPAFHALLKSKNDDLEAFFATVKELAGLNKEERRARLTALELNAGN